MTIRTTIRMDLKTKSISGTPSRVNAVQADKYSRELTFMLYDGSRKWAIPEGTSAIVRYCRADGSGGSYDLMPDGTEACSILGNTVTVKLAPAVLSVPGPVRVSVGLILGAQEINTFSVIVDVQPNPGLDVTHGDPEPDVYQQLQSQYTMLSARVSNLASSIGVTPQQYGAKGDGVTDDTEAIKRCIAANNNIYFPRGEYIMSEPLTIDKEGLVIVGDDGMTWGETCITFKSCDGVVFNVARYGAFKGVSIKAQNADNDFCGFKFNAADTAHKFQIENCMIFNFKYGISDSVGNQKCTIWNCSFRHMRTSNVEYAIYLAQADYAAGNNHFGVLFEDFFSDAGKVYISFGKYTFINCNFGIRCAQYLKLYYSCYTTWINCNFECDEPISSGYCLEINGREHLFINCQFIIKGESGVYLIHPESDLRMLKFIGCYSWTDDIATIWNTYGEYGTAGAITFTGVGMENPGYDGSFAMGGYNTNAENGLVSAYDEYSSFFPDNFMYWSPLRKEMSYYADGVINDPYGNDVASRTNYPVKIGGGFYLDGGEVEVTGDTYYAYYNRQVDGHVFVSNFPIIDGVPIMILRDESPEYKDKYHYAVFRIKMWDATNNKWVNNTKSFTLKWMKISL